MNLKQRLANIEEAIGAENFCWHTKDCRIYHQEDDGPAVYVSEVAEEESVICPQCGLIRERINIVKRSVTASHSEGRG